MSGPEDTAIEAIGVDKSFGSNHAVRGMDWAVRQGEVHALLGENGAGKSTLCSILAGLYQPDSGHIRIHGEQRVLSSPHDGLAYGVGMVYQEFRLVRSLTVAENLGLAAPDTGVFVRRRELEQRAAALVEQFGLAIPQRARVGDLSMGEQQRVEILQLLVRDAGVLILDEPTSVLTPQEADALFKTVRSLADSGRSVVLVSHKLDEVCHVADRITVLRDGRKVGQVQADELEPRALARLMVGREIKPASRTRTARKDAVALEVEGLRVADDRGRETVCGVDLVVHRGEILGIAGVSGNGQRELAEAIAGTRRSTAGTIRVGSSQIDVTRFSVTERARVGVAYVPDDRLHTGTAAGLPAWVNLSLRNFWHSTYLRGRLLMTRRLRANADTLIGKFSVKGVSRDGPVRQLSGGNLQRLILAREFEHEPDVVVAASPTRGLDVGAVVATHQLLFQRCEAGAGVLVISEDLDELLLISDRIAVLYEGRVVGECAPEDIDVETLGAWMSGHRAQIDEAVPHSNVEHGAAALGLVSDEASR
ncbi:MAG: ABC transporter ATP-binding protein [Acidimicrobiia bacterium]